MESPNKNQQNIISPLKSAACQITHEHQKFLNFRHHKLFFKLPFIILYNNYGTKPWKHKNPKLNKYIIRAEFNSIEFKKLKELTNKRLCRTRIKHR
uniref:Uncharacterized protein n=1 Tax=Kalanchoe fedtschenkoi TaxID=63787 RepID=A0A7N0VEQ3_KALFE